MAMSYPHSLQLLSLLWAFRHALVQYPELGCRYHTIILWIQWLECDLEELIIFQNIPCEHFENFKNLALTNFSYIYPSIKVKGKVFKSPNVPWCKNWESWMHIMQSRTFIIYQMPTQKRDKFKILNIFNFILKSTSS
jgi:hypothetical protein